MKTNKEVIEALQSYYLTKDPKLVARALANACVDYNRIANAESLPKNEFDLLCLRIQKNSECLQKFSKSGPAGDFKLFNLGAD